MRFYSIKFEAEYSAAAAATAAAAAAPAPTNEKTHKTVVN